MAPNPTLARPAAAAAGPAAAAPAADRPALNLALFVAVSLAEVLAVVTAWRAPYANLNWRPLSDAAVAALRACPAQLYNRYNDGGI